MGIDATEWRKDNGDDTKGMEYPLTKDSVVVEVGGYKGDWADAINRLYRPNLYVLEPVDEYFGNLLERFKSKDNVRLFNKGLGIKTGWVRMEKAGDKSRAAVEAEAGDRAYMEDAGEWFKQFKEIDLVQINCEGGEYGIFERLFKEGLIGRIKAIKVQFHKLNEESEHLRDMIRFSLKDTHRLVYDYPWVWESWERI